MSMKEAYQQKPVKNPNKLFAEEHVKYACTAL